MCRLRKVRTTGDETAPRSNDGDIRVKHWSDGVLLHPPDKSQYPYPLLASRGIGEQGVAPALLKGGETISLVISWLMKIDLKQIYCSYWRT